MDKQRIRIIRKNDGFSMEYQVGDIFTVDSTWYGGVNVTSASGIPLSLDRDEYEEAGDDGKAARPIDPYSYQAGVMDCFCDTREERDSYLGEVKRLCSQYGISYYPEDQAFITDLFPAKANQDKYNYLFYRTEDVLEQYLGLKERQKRLKQEDAYTAQARYDIAVEFGRLLSYPEEGIAGLIKKAAAKQR